MKGITKETFLRASDPVNRDAMLYDMLNSMDSKLTCVKDLKIRVEKAERKISFLRGIGLTITLTLSAFIAWIAKTIGGQ